MIALTFVLALLLAAIHIFTGRIRMLDDAPRSAWLSFAGGVGVAYVFLHILPDLSVHQRSFAKSLGVSDREAEVWVYLLTLAGLVAFYGLERLAKLQPRDVREHAVWAGASGLFLLHLASFALYNALVGYLLLHREEPGFASLALYFVAMGFHFLTNDVGLRHDHKARYHDSGRWLLAAAVLAGWALGAMTEISATAIGFLFAFLAGAVVLNVLKEELPRDRESRFFPFALGAFGYAGLLILAR
jgi:zinc transporter ZupT